MEYDADFMKFIEEMALAVNLPPSWFKQNDFSYDEMDDAFVAGRKAEREACAKIADSVCAEHAEDWSEAGCQIAKDIRARGDQ